MPIVQWNEVAPDHEMFDGWPPPSDVERIMREDPNVQRCLDAMTQDLEEEVVPIEDFLKQDHPNNEQKTQALVDDPSVFAPVDHMYSSEESKGIDFADGEPKAAVLTPIDYSPGEVFDLAGRKRWLKRVLPYAPIHYQGRLLNFTKEMAKKTAENFRKKPVEQVVFNFVDEDNKHNDDPRNVAGEVVDLQPKEDGLYAVIETNSVGTDYLTETNPNVGVSVRFIPNFISQWNKKFIGPIVQHVAATCDPHITGLGPWKALEASRQALREASGEDYMVIDLSNESYRDAVASDTGSASTDSTGEGGEDSVDTDIQANEETREEVQEEVNENVELSAQEVEKPQHDLTAVEEANAAAQRQIEELEKRLRASEEMLELSRKRELRASVHSMLTDGFADKGVPEWALEAAEEVLLFANAHAEQEVIELSASGQASVAEESIGDKIIKLLSAINTETVNLSGERGTQRPAEEVEQIKAEHAKLMEEYNRLAGVVEE